MVTMIATRRLAAVLLVAAAAAGCAYEGGVDNPVVRKLSWFSFIEGDDLRRACGPGAPDRFRLVYNAVYDEQVRIYELGGAGQPSRLRQRVIEAPNLALGADVLDPVGPWRGRTAERVLDEGRYRALLESFAADGVFGPPSQGLELPSRGFYWTAAACREGRWHFTAWLWPRPEFQRLRFDDLLFAADTTGVPPNPPRPLPPRYNDTGFYGDFTLRVGVDGLSGIPGR